MRNTFYLQFSTTLPDLGLDPIVDELPAAPKPENGLLPPPSSDEAETAEVETEEVKEEEERRVFPPEKEADGAARVLQKLICDGEGKFSRFFTFFSSIDGRERGWGEKRLEKYVFSEVKWRQG